MTLRLSLAAMALALAPGLAAAMCSDDQYIKSTASACAEGQVWDAATQGCVLKPTS
ncbi:MAG TPA: hypothetical protein PKD10_09865 [Paracoccaceae bacterium]|nr:hypothetical protein [Paracoccaceae bacterium]HMO73581.1 hypothetical protein [Paracoccaceae bacterium]